MSSLDKGGGAFFVLQVFSYLMLWSSDMRYLPLSALVDDLLDREHPLHPPLCYFWLVGADKHGDESFLLEIETLVNDKMVVVIIS